MNTVTMELKPYWHYYEKTEYVMRCTIWYQPAEACNFTKSNTPLWVFHTFFKLYKWYQIAQRITYVLWNIENN